MNYKELSKVADSAQKVKDSEGIIPAIESAIESCGIKLGNLDQGPKLDEDGVVMSLHHSLHTDDELDKFWEALRALESEGVFEVESGNHHDSMEYYFWDEDEEIEDSLKKVKDSAEVLIPCKLKEFCESFGYLEDDVIREVNNRSLEDSTQYFLEEVDQNLYQDLEPEDYEDQGDFYSSQVESAIETTYNWLHGSKVELCEWSGDWEDSDIIDLVKGLK